MEVYLRTEDLPPELARKTRYPLPYMIVLTDTEEERQSIKRQADIIKDELNIHELFVFSEGDMDTLVRLVEENYGYDDRLKRGLIQSWVERRSHL